MKTKKIHNKTKDEIITAYEMLVKENNALRKKIEEAYEHGLSGMWKGRFKEWLEEKGE